MNRQELLAFAVDGARVRLDQIDAERKAIFRTFPSLRGERAATPAPALPLPGENGSKPRRQMSRKARALISQRMKAYWQKRKQSAKPNKK